MIAHLKARSRRFAIMHACILNAAVGGPRSSKLQYIVFGYYWHKHDLNIHLHR